MKKSYQTSKNAKHIINSLFRGNKPSQVVTYEDGLKIRVFSHPDYGQLKAYTTESGRTVLDLSDVCRLIGKTEEQTVKGLGLEGLVPLDSLTGNKSNNH
ncbi:MAG: hypothetical protein LBS60_05440 [Deltaproteobacteria bacterium]|jgi:hypothetical protein|nr:hypothetical protein [Deltaproteobacteria bacterium]